MAECQERGSAGERATSGIGRAAAAGRGPPQQSPQADGDRLSRTGHHRGAAAGLGCRLSEEREWVDQMVRRVLAREARAAGPRGDTELADRAGGAGRRRTWTRCRLRRRSAGSATSSTVGGRAPRAPGTIRLSDRLRRLPGWVVDYVLLHELVAPRRTVPLGAVLVAGGSLPAGRACARLPGGLPGGRRRRRRAGRRQPAGRRRSRLTTGRPRLADSQPMLAPQRRRQVGRARGVARSRPRRRRGLEMAHRFRDRQPQPMQESSPSRSRSRAAICSSSRDRQCRVIRCQSARVGVRPWGSRASSSRISSRLSPTLLGGSDEGEAAQHARARSVAGRRRCGWPRSAPGSRSSAAPRRRTRCARPPG